MKFIFKKRGWYKYNIILILSLLVFCVQPLVVAEDDNNEIREESEEGKALIKAIEEKVGKKMNQMTKEEWEEYWQRVWKEILHVMAGRYILQGEVVDEAGVRLNGVEVKIDKHGKDLDRGNREPEWIINGTFNLDIKGYINLRLWFSKSGYYSESIDFGFREEDIPPEVHRAIMEGKKVEPLVLKKEGIRVVLEKQGTLTSLIRYTGPLEYTTGGKGIIINFNKHPASSLRVIENIEDPKQLHENCVYMVVEKDWDGGIAAVTKVNEKLTEKEKKGLPERWWKYVVPKRVRLIMNADGGGFIRYTLDPNKKPTRQMKEAPETGYEKEIVIENDDISKEEGGGWKGVIFYFKTKDKYGKGSVSMYEDGVSEDRSSLKLNASFDLQPDGSRNLETGDK